MRYSGRIDLLQALPCEHLITMLTSSVTTAYDAAAFLSLAPANSRLLRRSTLFGRGFRVCGRWLRDCGSGI